MEMHHRDTTVNFHSSPYGVRHGQFEQVLAIVYRFHEIKKPRRHTILHSFANKR